MVTVQNTFYRKFKKNILLSLLELKNDLQSFIDFCKSNILTVILTWFFILLSYGIKLFYYSISIDTEAIINNYTGQSNAWLSIGRFGLMLTKKIFRLVPFNPYAACFLMLCAMFVFCLTWSYLLNYLAFEKNKKSIYSCIFPIVFLTAPLFAEQFNFILQGFEVAFAIILCSLAVFFISKWIISSSNIVHLILGLGCMVWGFSSYQAILSLYISGVLACYIMIYISCKNQRIVLNKNFFKLAVAKYLGTFIFGYFSYYILNKAVSVIYATTPYLDNSILWGKVPVKQCVKQILQYISHTVIGDGMFYSKKFILIVLAFLIYALINLFSQNKDKILFLLAVGAFLLSPFFLSILLGQALAPRSQFSLQFVIAFGIYFLLLLTKNKKIHILGVVFAVFLALNQGYVVSRLLYTDYIKYQSEVALANKISTRIENLNLGEIPKYPVVFVGSYHPINTPLELRGDVIGASFFEWDAVAPYGSNYRILGFMQTIGYPYINPTQEQIEAGKKISKNMQSWPNTDSVKFADDIIVVKLSN